MGQGGSLGSKYAISANSGNSGVNEKFGLFNNGVAHNLKLYQMHMDGYAPNPIPGGNFGWTLKWGTGGTPLGTITPVPLDPIFPPALAIGVQNTWSLDPSGTYTILRIAGQSPRKPWNWSARPGKEIQIYGASDSLVVYQDTAYGFNPIFTWFFEE
jgi:hypothetical protein